MASAFPYGGQRRRDPFEGISPRMRAALHSVRCDEFAGREGGRGLHAGTLRALALRGLVRNAARPDCPNAGFALTAAGRSLLIILTTRALAAPHPHNHGRLT